MTKSKIEWTDETLNVVTGCTHVSPGCDNCYMFALYPRLNGMGVKGYEATPDTVQLIPDRLDLPNRWTRPRRVFVNSMSDTFHPQVPFDYVSRLFTVMAENPMHTFQVLTKRPGRAVAWWEQHGRYMMSEWPTNVWIGTSIENQKYVPRAQVLSRIPAETRFISAEPLLGSVDLSVWLKHGYISWVIAGGESGPRARPMDLDWARQLRDQCLEHNVAFFLKQLGGRDSKHGGKDAILDGKTWTQFPSLDNAA